MKPAGVKDFGKVMMCMWLSARLMIIIICTRTGFCCSGSKSAQQTPLSVLQQAHYAESPAKALK
ncbi:hypothetical protein CS542_01970 [Pedobacter sp. IW39]|nr:hypothetical protein CS542_01970 [Pedobacter sp. IW39]